MEHLVIIGNGITGITVARNVRKRSDMKITVISSESEYFYSRTALIYVYMGHLKWDNIKPYEDWFWEKNRIELIYSHAVSINTGTKTVTLIDNREISFDKLVVATGSKTNKFGWPGQDLPGVQGLYSRQDLEMLDSNTRDITDAVIVGGGLIGIELAEMLHTKNIHVTFLVREKHYWGNILPPEEASLVERLIIEQGMDLKLGTQLKEILPSPNGKAGAAVTDKGEKIECGFVGLTPGVHPNIDLAKSSNINTGRGVLVNEYLETNIPGIYSAGDCAEIVPTDCSGNNKPATPGRVEQLWYTGKMQAEVLAENILGNRIKYDRGVWFNSAKFFDTEYQTYGYVNNVLPRDGEETFYWEHPAKKKCFRAVYSSGDRSVKGFNVFGIRLRQQVCERWIKEKRTVEYVIRNLREANFDPEFFAKYEGEILSEFSRKNRKEIF